MFRKRVKVRQDLIYRRAKDKADRMSRGELADWIDVVGTDLATAARNYHAAPGITSAHDIHQNAIIMSALGYELCSRFNPVK